MYRRGKKTAIEPAQRTDRQSEMEEKEGPGPKATDEKRLCRRIGMCQASKANERNQIQHYPAESRRTVNPLSADSRNPLLFDAHRLFPIRDTTQNPLMRQAVDPDPPLATLVFQQPVDLGALGKEGSQETCLLRDCVAGRS